MNTDVLPPCGGFLVISIDPFGYIHDEHDGRMIHRETRNLHLHAFDFPYAKERLPEDEECCILELTAEGGGAALWMREAQIPELTRRRDRWKGCYGAWPIHTLSL